ncbi:21acee09-618b-46ad-a937-a67df7a25c24 [Thermothielavioides terrestris]|uniref:Uncharacterized protein n=2 Tax=Thermothielavioides terrestris TaxID=2587410 RepID=G2RCL2_THETT|nr:uncharacterized protein THITE_2069336 [Thermothielavioides terrestris NRRL 8126]AEO69803.1 hypothetical protein THITE_2069336 [Thermothielavioides terrestris NRRL 8126]SPQ17600.1 21acee09-618b-46ad-a937-a67df7a25c24 [Thermothielavioides terrestris]
MARTAANVLEDPQITVRLKHGIHTIFLFAMLDWSFSRLTTELLSILRDRYKDGLTTSIAPPKITPVPANDGDGVRVAYAVPANPSDLSQGWKNLKVKPEDTLGKKGLTDMCSVAFSLLDSDADEEGVEFLVELPSLEGEEL